MNRGFYTIMAAQFFSSLADNAIFVTAVELLKTSGAPEWQRAALVPMFALFYVVLAPFVGALADRLPKGQVMFYANAVKVIGCLMMLFGVHPLAAYAIVGLGAAIYSPAKYGILTELLPSSQLVKANGWIEGLTIASIILGVLLGGQLVGPMVSQYLLSFDMPGIQTGVNTAPEAAICTLIFVYLLAAIFNLRIPRTSAALIAFPHKLFDLVADFRSCNKRLWNDKLGQISLSATTIFWGAGGNLRYIVLAWAGVALGYTTTQASNLTGVVAVGTAAGAIWASTRTRLDQAPSVIPLGIGIGLVVILMNFITNLWVAVPFLIALGAFGGYLVVPMNALLQHRGASLMGAGRSIAVQNFNEQACILFLGFFYTGMTTLGIGAFGAITAFGLVVAGAMYLVKLWHENNLKKYPEEVNRLLDIARTEGHH
jgi:MFS transporter, LPLT family, lysophospholipid transporter